MKVIQNGIRPSLPKWIPKVLDKLIRQTYDTNPDVRPKLEVILEKLERIEQNEWKAIAL